MFGRGCGGISFKSGVWLVFRLGVVLWVFSLGGLLSG